MDYALPSWATDRIPCALCNRLIPANHLANAPIHGGGVCEDCCIAECEADADDDLDFYNARNYKVSPSLHCLSAAQEARLDSQTAHYSEAVRKPLNALSESNGDPHEAASLALLCDALRQALGDRETWTLHLTRVMLHQGPEGGIQVDRVLAEVRELIHSLAREDTAAHGPLDAGRRRSLRRTLESLEWVLAD